MVLCKNHKGFTLIEMLIAMTIFVTFIGILMSSYTSIVRAQRDANDYRETYVKARQVFDLLKIGFMSEFDDNGNIGKRYRRQDELGTPYCVTIDFDTLKDDTITLRNRDTMEQERIRIFDIRDVLADKLK